MVKKLYKKKLKFFLSYLKPYKKTFAILIIGLLIEQFCSLFLPNFMSNIVDVGINQGGIESPIPEAMTVESYKLFSSFLSADQNETISQAYILINSDYEKESFKNNFSKFFNRLFGLPKSLNERYPILQDGEKIYIINAHSSNLNKKKLEQCFLEASTNIVKYMMFLKDSEENKLDFEKDFYEIDLSCLYKILDTFEKNGYNKNIENIGNLDVSIDSVQAACSINKKIYSDLKMDVFKIQSSYILKSGFIMLLITVFGIVIASIQNYLTSKMSARISMKLRSDVFKKVESFSIKEFDEFSTASLITRTTNDVSQVMNTIFMIVQFFVPPLMLFGGLIMAIQKSISLIWTIALGAIVSAGIILTGVFIIYPKIDLMQKLVDKFNLILRERILGAATIRIFGGDKFEEDRFKKVNRELTDMSSFVTRVSMFMSPILNVFMDLISVVVIWLSVYQIQQSKMQIGDVMAFMQYAAMVVGAFLTIIMMIASLPKSMISINRIYDILSKEPCIKSSPFPLHFKKEFEGKVEFKDVSFKYENAKENVLQNINFTALPGQITAIIGKTGSGKSTLIKLIPRLYDINNGEILIDGINIKNVSQEELREKISYAPQNSMLFSGSIESNIKISKPDISESNVKKCLNISQFSDFIEKSPDGINLKINQNGSNLSGGQKQRLSIARSIAKDSPIYLFDDIFSALDFKTENLLRKSLFEHIKGFTVIISSQRIFSVMDSDKIIVMDEGKIVSEGKHEELLKDCKIYREMFSLQVLTEEEII